MKSLSDEDAGIVFWEDFCDANGWNRTPNKSLIAQNAPTKPVVFHASPSLEKPSDNIVQPKDTSWASTSSDNYGDNHNNNDNTKKRRISELDTDSEDSADDNHDEPIHYSEDLKNNNLTNDYEFDNEERYLHPLISTIGRQRYLTQLELNTCLVQEVPNAFLSAFLALQHLKLLRIYMIVKSPTIPDSNSDDERSNYSFESYSHSDFFGEDEDEDEDKIEREEIQAFNDVKPQLRTNGYHMITKLELPPRQYLPYPATFLEPLFHSGLPNLQSLTLPRCAEGPPSREEDFLYRENYKDIDFRAGRWSCTGLEVLRLSNYVSFGSQRVGSSSQGYKSYTEPRTHLWTQVGHLLRLQELEIGNTGFDSMPDVYWIKDLRLEAPIIIGQDEEHDSCAAEGNQGLLHLLRGLRNLRVLRLRTDYWPRWILPGQAEVEFMEQNWPYLRKFSYVSSRHDVSGGSLEDEPQWGWFKHRWPELVINRNVNLNEPGSQNNIPNLFRSVRSQR
ncbi:hypothetical protein BX616_008538 [Lobosporangium transversale]|uniref:Uncharacterized protein n=1 Tax=Lobosporangium transversale TaxID=64571 RepID=A0A1Y2GFJ7_9FUNG|nr:hypothetical protein BCR41DRAFT_398828 [Lobosporangium transversale]KAF9914318.1 hypothetical protein BX616_008538 [Lobosporangium transversale]ORZ09390.1 hypothetical protein BCR41DRAFT_398828 [Lobosporangium transversale]|eukprot:XP_021878843.1 hypothetical protein BCR41DRAFT_398828 [Lobosporangium transversale]